MATTTPQIIHEAEVHRQHVRLKIPITVEIDGTRHAIDDWSIGGFGVQGEMPSHRPGDRFAARVAFPFEDFELVLRVDCQLVYIAPDHNRFGCRFIGLSEGQLRLFRYVIDGYLSGEIISGVDLLSLAGRDNTAVARLQPVGFDPDDGEATLGRKVRRWLGFLLMLLAGVALAVLIAIGVKERWLTIRADAAIVEAPVHRLRAPATGTLEPGEVPPLLRPGDALGVIRTAEGQTAPITSPCECTLLDWSATSGQPVTQGDPIGLLVAADRPLSVRASVPIDKGHRLRQGDVVEIVLPGRDGVVLGQIERIDQRAQLAALASGDPLAAARRSIQVVIRPDRPLDFDKLGALVEVRFP